MKWIKKSWRFFQKGPTYDLSSTRLKLPLFTTPVKQSSSDQITTVEMEGVSKEHKLVGKEGPNLIEPENCFRGDLGGASFRWQKTVAEASALQEKHVFQHVLGRHKDKGCVR